MTSAPRRGEATPRPPRYIDALIDDFSSGDVSRFNHLGHWTDPADPFATSRVQAQAQMVVELEQLARVGDGSTVLDVGSGFGGTLLALDRAHRGVHLVGLDVDGRQLAMCRDLRAGEANLLSWVQGDGCTLPVASASIDHVLSIEAMWHFPSRSAFLGEVGRVLRPGGTAAVVDLFVEPGAAAAMGLTEAQLVERLDAGFAPWPELHATEAELRVAADRAGLACTACVDATANTKPTYLDHGDAAARPGAASFSSSAAVELFVALHRRDLLRVVYLAFERRSPR